MGSLPVLPSSPLPPQNQIDPGELSLLFKSQQQHLNHFFHNLDLGQAHSFADSLLSAPAAIFFTGVGKSGFVAHKLSQTLASLGLARSAFLPPVDALHGDIGALFPGDLLVLISKSGSSDELLNLVPCARAKGARLLSITSVVGNPLAALCDANVHLPLQRELCPFGLAPVTSTAIHMVFGDTVIAAIMRAKKLTKEQYAANHPAGKIGKSLIFKVKDLMKQQEQLPFCKEGDMIMDQLTELTSKGCGCLLVVDDGRRLIGTFTDGDLRRTLKASGEAIFKLAVGEMCNRFSEKFAYARRCRVARLYSGSVEKGQGKLVGAHEHSGKRHYSGKLVVGRECLPVLEKCRERSGETWWHTRTVGEARWHT